MGIAAPAPIAAPYLHAAAPYVHTIAAPAPVAAPVAYAAAPQVAYAGYAGYAGAYAHTGYPYAAYGQAAYGQYAHPYAAYPYAAVSQEFGWNVHKLSLHSLQAFWFYQRCCLSTW